ncbi:MAG TPA: DUF1501 domain-containing protein, partial [Pirellulales bacterium]|nr:DUF1501 domain-containing protein [Pirellulales bacterium]
MHPLAKAELLLSRRHFLGRSALGLGTAALASLLERDSARAGGSAAAAHDGLPGLPHFPAKAKRVIYLFQSGAPSQADLFDYKPLMEKFRGQDLPESVRMGQRLTGMSSGQKAFPIAPTMFKFAQHGKSGAWVSELMPHLAGVVDDLCFIKSMHTEAINHDPAITFIQTGSQQPGRPSLGAWLSYGLGSANADLPTFVVMISQGSGKDSNQGLLERLWGSGFLPSSHQGVKLRSGGDAVLYLSDPAGIDRGLRRQMLDRLAQLN